MMKEQNDKANAIRSVIDRLRQGEISEDMCGVIRRYPIEFERMGVYRIDIMSLLDLKAKLAFCPDPRSYSIQESGRVNYIYKNLDNPDIELSGENEKRFAEALSFYYSLEAEYKHRVDTLVDVIYDKYNRRIKEVHDSIVKDDAADLFTGILFKKEFPPITETNYYSMQFLFNKYDLHDVYNMADNKALLEWKAARGAESAGFLDEGFAEVLFIDAGIDTDELENRITRYKIEKMRISKAEVFTRSMSAKTYIRCCVDGQDQQERELSTADVAGRNPFVNITGLAVKYFQKVLDWNREANKAVVDEKALARINMGTVERLVDIAHHGLSREDVMLLNISQDDNTDNFWKDTGLLEIDSESVAEQKWCAFEKLADYLSDLRPGMLSDDEIIHASLLSQYAPTVTRESEVALMKMPEIFFPLIEQSKAWKNDIGVIDYVKVMREIGRVTPEIACNSMDYFLKNRLHKECYHEDDEEERQYWSAVGAYDFPNQGMKNPADRFPPNLINEEQWTEFGRREFNQGAEFIPYGAFRKDRITEVQVYPSGDGGMAVRCKVDDVQQCSRRLSEADMLEYDSGADARELAAGYYMDAFAREPERDVTLRR